MDLVILHKNAGDHVMKKSKNRLCKMEADQKMEKKTSSGKNK